ncbi:hemopexin-like [Hemiscyllium ocellatum]|uniref:hemopexin-like n=1 Tax=Hemiscyllium ocellatum TaxID=170820 RepID=UPI002966165D|nr:hemopexin-like [Hemiscyllium ocellatum]
MKLLLGGLCLSWAVVLSFSYPWMKHIPNITEDELSQGHTHPNHAGFPNRCDGLGFDAITLDEQGVTYFFRDAFLWRGFQAPAQFINETWSGLPDHIDAAFRMHHKNSPEQHDRMFFFKGNHVWQYNGNKPEGQFLIQDKFHGVPDNLGAAVECPQGECQHDSVLFFKGDTTYLFDLSTKTVKVRPWTGTHQCTAAMRWIDRNYCFQGSNFTRFNPHTGQAFENYPKDARNYFMRCEGRGHGNKTADPSIYNRCSNRSFDEFNEDELGRVYAFRANVYFRLDSKRDGWHPWQIHSTWPSLHGKIDGVFTWNKKIYFIQGSQLFIYKAEAQYTLIEGYPKPITEELGISGAGVDATFICPGTSLLYVIRGNRVQSVNLEQTPRVLDNGFQIGHSHVDGAMCNTEGIFIFVGTNYYKYSSTKELEAQTETPDPHSISVDFMSCVH